MRGVQTMLAFGAATLCGVAQGAPELDAWGDPGRIDAVAASRLAGAYATASCQLDRVVVRDIEQSVVFEIDRAGIQALVPWMTLDASADGPGGVALSDSGRLLFIAVHDDTPAPDGMGSDAVIRVDLNTGSAGVFARLERSDQTTSPEHLALLHTHGRLYVGTWEAGLRVYSATRNQIAGGLLGAAGPGGAAPVRGLGEDRDLGMLYAATDEGFYRAGLDQVPPLFTRVGDLSDARGMTHSDHYGDDSTRGVYVVTGAGQLLHVTDLQALGIQSWGPSAYATLGSAGGDVCATACGRLLIGTDAGGLIGRDTLDPRPAFGEWLLDEFAGVVAFAKGLIHPDGEPEGWVIDADVDAGASRFHPATPDAAGWALLLLIMNDELTGDPEAEGLVRAILERYAGLAPDGIGPVSSADGIFRHYIDPVTGGVKPGWDPEFATLSTMKIVMGAHRARAYYPQNAAIQEAADAIIGQVGAWASYLQPGSDALYFRGQAGGGPVPGTASAPFHEGIIFVEQAASYGDAGGALTRWLDRSLSPSATYVTGQPVTTGTPGVHQAAFVSLYSALVQAPFRQDPAWRAHLANLLASNGAWTDDHAPAFMTVFSAGTTAPAWGGYHADSLSDHPGDVTSFPALMAFGALGDTAPAVGAYHAFRHGARQSFASGASVLFRRSAENPAFEPTDAALPDVALGALGLAELLQPGVLDDVLAIPYHATCEADLAPPAGVLDFSDVLAFLAAFAGGEGEADLAPPLGQFDFSDVVAFLSSFSGGCP